MGEVRVRLCGQPGDIEALVAVWRELGVELVLDERSYPNRRACGVRRYGRACPPRQREERA